MTLADVRELLGWCTLINFGLLLFSAVLIVTFRNTLSKIHGRMFGLETAEVQRAYFQYFAHYKIAIIVFNAIPYLALRIMLYGE